MNQINLLTRISTTLNVVEGIVKHVSSEEILRITFGLILDNAT